LNKTSTATVIHSTTNAILNHCKHVF
jgi:hypothetical protein